MTTQQHIEAVRKAYPQACISSGGLLGYKIYKTYLPGYNEGIGYGQTKAAAWQDAYNNLPKNEEQ